MKDRTKMNLILLYSLILISIKCDMCQDPETQAKHCEVGKFDTLEKSPKGKIIDNNDIRFVETSDADSNLWGVIHIARLFLPKKDDNTMIGDCTGFMVSKNYMMTAGHCFYDKNGALETIMNDQLKCSSGSFTGYIANQHGSCVRFNLLKGTSDFTKSLLFSSSHRNPPNAYMISEIVDYRYNDEDDWALIKLSKNIQTSATFNSNNGSLISPNVFGTYEAGDKNIGWGYFDLVSKQNFPGTDGHLYRAGFGYDGGTYNGLEMHIDSSGNCDFTKECKGDYKYYTTYIRDYCDMIGGDSGAPLVLINSGKVIAINTSHLIKYEVNEGKGIAAILYYYLDPNSNGLIDYIENKGDY